MNSILGTFRTSASFGFSALFVLSPLFPPPFIFILAVFGLYNRVSARSIRGRGSLNWTGVCYISRRSFFFPDSPGLDSDFAGTFAVSV